MMTIFYFGWTIPLNYHMASEDKRTNYMDYFNEFQFWSLAANVSIMKNSTLHILKKKKKQKWNRFVMILGWVNNTRKSCENDPSKLTLKKSMTKYVFPASFGLSLPPWIAPCAVSQSETDRESLWALGSGNSSLALGHTAVPLKIELPSVKCGDIKQAGS